MNSPLIHVRHPTLRALLVLTMVACSCGAAGCEDPNKLFEGVWETTEDAHDALGGQFVGAPTLAIGHYGRDLTGLVYLHEALGASGFTSTCNCALIEQGTGDTIDLASRHVTFTSTCTDAEPGTVSLDWELTMGDESDPEERTLSGTIIRSDGASGVVDVHFRRVSLDVEDADKQCPSD